MAMVAPAVVRGAATPKAASTKAASSKAATSAAGRASELMASGATRKQAHTALRREFGGTPAETDGLLDGVGATDPEGPPRTAPPSRPTAAPSVPRSVSGAVNAGGGAILGALAYVLALTYLRDGKPGVKRWYAAKFLNRVATTSAGTSAAGGGD
jgi:hypothetical protein